MKKIISIFACLAMLLSFAMAEDSGFGMFRLLYTPGQNTVYSPLSLDAALGMAAEGASGVTRDEIAAVLGDADSEEVNSANAVFAAPDIVLRENYRAVLDEKYAAEYFPIDTDIVEDVNAWVSEKTLGMIPDLLQTPPDQAGLILINAVAMEKDWLKPFDEALTAGEDFFTSAGTVSVQMMHQTSRFTYAEKDGVQIICLPYRGSSLEMWIALPEEGGMDVLLENLSASGMDYLTSDAQSKEVILSLPKADVQDQNDLIPALRDMGVNAAFTSDADFSGISETPLFISGVTQKARIMMNEKSTSAAAATMVMMARGAMMEAEPPVEMTVNRPYVFAVFDNQTGAVCFTGIIENPAQ